VPDVLMPATTPSSRCRRIPRPAAAR
jgi:hypothetical protein